MKRWLKIGLGAAVLSVGGCLAVLQAGGDTSKLPPGADFGPNPTLVAPVTGLMPTVNIATAVGWAPGGAPVAAPGLKVTAYATGLDHPRWLYRLPNGDILVAETNRPSTASGLTGMAERYIMGQAGAGVAGGNRISLLRDADGDGVPELKTPFIEGLNAPFGMALVGETLYVATAEALIRFPYKAGETKITAPPERVVDLPGGPLNHHWTKNLVAAADGKHLYVAVGSNSNVGENGMEVEKDRAAILEVDPAARTYRVFASGLRNPVGMGFEPVTGKLWTSVNERDELGSDLVPDYMTSVVDGGFYGWPYSYYGQHVDTRVEPQRPDLVAKALVPDYALGAHTASLGLAFAEGTLLPPAFRAGAFVGQHGSWNRDPRAGYKVIFVPFAVGKPAGLPVDVLTGFLSPEGDAWGRPVGVAFDRLGALLVADDVGNAVWRVAP
ncbi:sorbosone dehydrogenase family protein [Zavarzinia sp.]|uniref:PQQ-dependent sugar dehydrogenase n=1 Tax=Zavarzinia sp. TaxID=2027920 RepID=UPI0035654FA3